MMKDPLLPQPPPTSLELDTKSFVDLSEFSPTTFSPTSECTSADGLLTASLLPTLSNTFIFPNPGDDKSMHGASTGSISSRGTRPESRYGGSRSDGRHYPGYEWDGRSLKRSLEQEIYVPPSLSEGEGREKLEHSCQRCCGRGIRDPMATSSPAIDSAMEETPISESRILNFFLATSQIPYIQPTATDLFLGSIYTASALRLLFQGISMTVLQSSTLVLSTEITILLSIICLTSLTAWFASAGRAMKSGWAAWGCTVTFRFLTTVAGVYALLQLISVLTIAFDLHSVSQKVENITITVPSILERQHILDILVKLQGHVSEYISTVERDMISYVNSNIDSGNVDEKVMDRLEKLYAGLVALGELDGGVLGEVLKGLWGGV
ncbi:hypothetical protein EYR41_006527 [Orbilia oligospora]|uniref:Uncharacterized protein n=1 Tax=Orbilia oligospora TaxID=2813651 RepID=A0A7C8TRI1_ORBOL|nr:hypothetical protein TWF751_001906 [Orbilia oligospora]TGJ67396.1 hypothetical protein EYR41_006527 [Orbilia oligospora]